ncbi:hypothetical protein Sdia_08890 [Streptomyces diastaticus subsp. diastaticus]|uniref:Uncharacterized protein n=1 Tax=Streptomyces diastaticus subsp. diastaticus TaxID=68040 RepID=A0ABQ1CJ90_STRDI|nr:hypothetical protein Srut_10370 [Streptomyces rutgersensis]GFH70121.1 hypothetical protein Sdia_08890 [Streptomyces diastaticus subsp. diastaticus]GGU15243.1 hypothetical protein GCM10015534_17350 [Streptomyces diastaticus subsp. diastaticus]
MPEEAPVTSAVRRPAACSIAPPLPARPPGRGKVPDGRRGDKGVRGGEACGCGPLCAQPTGSAAVSRRSAGICEWRGRGAGIPLHETCETCETCETGEAEAGGAP